MVEHVALCRLHFKDGQDSCITVRVVGAENVQAAIEAIQEYTSWPFEEITTQVSIVQISPVDEMRTIQVTPKKRRRRKRARSG